MELPAGWVLGASSGIALAAGPWLATLVARLAARDATARPRSPATVVLGVLFALLTTGALLLTGVRPATAAFAWAAGAAVVLGAVDLISHRLPDRITFPAYGVCTGALLVDAAVQDSWAAAVRAVLACGVAAGLAAIVALAVPAGLGFGDVKLLGLLGLLLGWVGWGVLLTGVFLGLVLGSLTSVALIATRRASWRTSIPFGPPLLAGAVGALALAGPVPLG